MPHGTWSAKDERMYKHIKTSCLARGQGKKTCERIGAATVNKFRGQGLGDIGLDPSLIDMLTVSPARCHEGKDPSTQNVYRFCKSTRFPGQMSIRLTDAEDPDYTIGISRVQLRKGSVVEEWTQALGPSEEMLLMQSMARLACQRRSYLTRSRDTARSPWWLDQVQKGNAKSVFPGGPPVIGTQRACELGKRRYQRAEDDSYQISPHVKKRCVTRNMPNGWRQRVCKTLDTKQFSSFDVRLKDSQGRVLGKGMFTESGGHVHTEGVIVERAVDVGAYEISNEIFRTAARVACRKKLDLLGPGAPGDSRRSLDYDFWDVLLADGRAEPYQSRTGRKARPHSDDTENDRRLVLEHGNACLEGKKPSLLDPGTEKKQRWDHFLELSPIQRVNAKCRTARANRNQQIKICSRKPNRADSFRGFDVKVIDKTGQVIGKGLFSIGSNVSSRGPLNTIWTIDVKGTPEAQLDIELLAARMACTQQRDFVSSFEPNDSYFWRTQSAHLGRARRHPEDDGSLVLSAKDACKGTPMYGPKGLIESHRRRPGIYFSGLTRGVR